MPLRPALAEDIPALARLLAELFAIEKDFVADFDKQCQGLRLLLASPTGQILVAIEADEVVGMVSGQLLVSTAEGGAALLLEDLVVSANHRRRQLGNQLLQALEEWARGCGATRMQLLADRDNASALAYYAKRGWNSTHLVCLRKRIGKEE